MGRSCTHPCANVVDNVSGSWFTYFQSLLCPSMNNLNINSHLKGNLTREGVGSRSWAVVVGHGEHTTMTDGMMTLCDVLMSILRLGVVAGGSLTRFPAKQPSGG